MQAQAAQGHAKLTDTGLSISPCTLLVVAVPPPCCLSLLAGVCRRGDGLPHVFCHHLRPSAPLAWAPLGGRPEPGVAGRPCMQV